MFALKTEAEIKANNNLNTDRPIIAYMPDWRHQKKEDGEVS